MDDATLIGSTLGNRYRLLEAIGEGGMGRVYRAAELATGKSVAIKLLHAEFVGDDQVVQRFEREAKVMTELSHPHIAKVIELGEWNGRLFLAMELLAGKTLADVIARDARRSGGRLTLKRTLAIIRPVLDALDYAHARGVVHRDLKPENIMVIAGRGLYTRESVKLLDFGIAKLGDRSGKTTQKLTQQGFVMGTPDYMSPEQAVGQEADVRSDLYSCGVILYQMLTGHRPFEADSNVDVLVMHLNTSPKPLRDVANGAWIPHAVEGVVLRALAKRPAERFQSARELRQALEQAVVIGYGNTRSNGAAASSARLSTGSRLLSLAITAAVVAMLLGDHLRLHAGGAGKSTTASAGEPTASRGRDRRSSTELGRESSERARRNAKQVRPTAKRALARGR